VGRPGYARFDILSSQTRTRAILEPKYLSVVWLTRSHNQMGCYCGG